MRQYTRRTVVSSGLALLLALSVYGVALAANNGQLVGSGSISGEPLIGGGITFDISVINDPTGVGVFYQDRLYSVTGVVILPPDVTLNSCSITPSAVLQDTPNPGETEIRFENIKNLEVNERVAISCSTTLAPTLDIGDVFTIDYRWEAYTNPCESCAGEWRYFPGPTPADYEPISATPQAIDLEKGSSTTTGEAQVNGADAYEPAPAPGHGPGPDWPYTYTLTLTNNPLNPVNQVRVFDIIPPGVAYLGNDVVTCSAHGAPVSSAPIRTLSDGSIPDTVDGSLVLEWNLDTLYSASTVLQPGETCTFTYQTAIPYRERRSADGVTVGGGPFSGPVVGGPDATHRNNYYATGNYEHPVDGNIPQIDGSTPGATPGDDAPVIVHSSYQSITKSSNTSAVYQDTVISYSVTGYISEYYDFTASAGTPYVITDVIPDGLEFCSTIAPGDTDGFYDECSFVTTSAQFNGAPLDPVSVAPSGDDLLVTWHITDPSVVEAGDTWTLTYRAVVRDFYVSGLPVSGLDVRPNNVSAQGEWNDLVDPGRTGTDTTGATTSIRVGSPAIDKRIWDPSTGTWVQGPVTLEIGQQFSYQIQLTFDEDLDMRNVIVDDSMPMAQRYIPNSADFTGSQGFGDTIPLPNTPQATQGQYGGTTYQVEGAQNFGNFRIDFCPYNDTLGRVDGNPSDPFLTVFQDLTSGRQRLEWFLCRIDNSDTGNTIIWQVDFDGVVVDDTQVYNGCQVNNFGHLSGTNSFGTTYSLRDNLTSVYAVPNLVMRKTNTAPDPITASGPFDYTLSVENDGGIDAVGNAYDWTIRDIIPAGLRVPTTGGVCDSFSTDAPGDYSCTADAGAQAGTGGFVTIRPVDGLGSHDPTRPIPPATTYNFTFQTEMTDVSPGAASADEELFNTASVEFCTWPMPLDLDNSGSTDRRCEGFLADTVPHSDEGGTPTYADFRDYTDVDDAAPNGNETDNTDTSRVHVIASTTDKAHIAPAHVAPQVSGDFATIGEVYQVMLDVGVPPRTILYSDPTAGYVEVIDTFIHEGAIFCDLGDGITGCANPVITQTGGLATPDTAQSPSTPDWWQADNASPAPGSTVRFFLETLDNSLGTADYTFTITFTMLVTGENEAGDAVFFLPGTNDVVLNSFVVRYFNDNPTPVEFTTPTANDQIDIDQPHITTDKEAVSITRPGVGVLCSSAAACDSVEVQGNDTISYRMTYASDGESTAFDVWMIDLLPDYVTYDNNMVCTSDTAPPVSGGVVSTFPAPAPYTTELLLDTTPGNGWDLPPGSQVTCAYTVTVEPSVPAGTVLSNFTDADWSTIDGTPAAPAPEERQFDDGDVNGNGTPNDDGAQDEDTKTLQVIIPVAGKTRLAPDPTVPGTPPHVRIGDVIDYQITIPLPIGRTQDLVITDLFDPGLIYDESGTLSIYTNTLSLIPTQTLNGTNDGLGAFSVDWAVSDPACTPVAGATNCIYNDGVNNTVVTVDLQAIVADVPLNVDGLVLDNDMQADFRDGLGNPRAITHGGAQDDEEVLVTEPHLTLTKTAAPSTVDAGDPIAYTVTMTNDGTATAYDVSFDENLDDRTAYDTSTPMVCTHSASGPVSFELDATPFDGTPDTPTVGMDIFRVAGDLDENSNGWDLAPGESITCTYQVLTLVTVGPGYTIDNLADADWSSLDGPVSGGATDPREREYDDHDGAEGFPGHTATDDQDTATVNVPAPTIAKSRTSGATVQPGQLVTYQVVATVPEGTITNLSITDTLPLPLNAFRFESASAPVAGWGGALPAFSTQPAVGASGTLTWTFSAPITNPGDNDTTNNTITLAYTIRVYGNAAGGVNTNTAQASYTNEAGGTSTTNTSDASVDVIRPGISVTKAMTPAGTHDAGDILTYTVTISNSGPGVAYDVYFNENLDAYTDYDPSFTMTCVQNPGAAPLIYEMDDLSDGFDTTPDGFVAALDQFRIAGDLDETSNSWALSSGQSIACAYHVIIRDDARAGSNTIRNSALINTVNGWFDSADSDQLGEEEFTAPATSSVNIGTPTFTSKTRTSPVVGVDDIVQPGELVSYRIIFTVPEGATNNLRITDTLPAGFALVSVDSITTGWGGALPGFSAPVPPAPGFTTGTLNWNFSAPVVNPGDNDTTNNTITFNYTVRVMASAASTPPPLSTLPNTQNNGSFSYIPAGGARTTPGSGRASVDVVRPAITVDKTVAPASGDAGDVLAYTITITNSGPGVAYDVYFEENLDPYTDYDPSFTMTCVQNPGATTRTYQMDDLADGFDATPDGFSAALDQFRIAGDLDETANPWTLAVGQSISCTYQVVANQDVPASDSIANAVTGYGDTVDGDVPGEDTLTGGDTAQNQTPDATITKSNDASAAEYQSDDAYAPGDLVPYELTVRVPEGSIVDMVVCENLPAQLGYDSTTGIANSDGVTYTPAVDYSIVTAGFPAACPAGTDVAYQFTSPLVLDDTPNADNATPGGDFKTITIRYLARVLSAVTDGQLLTNTAALTYTRGDNGTTQTASDGETIIAEVVSQATDKAITTIHRGSSDVCTDEAGCNTVEVNSGDILTYSLSLTNTHATATAYEVTMSDNVPLHLSYNGDLACQRVPGGPLATTPLAPGSDPILIDAAVIGTVNLAPGETLICTYTATVQASVPAGFALTNTVTGAVTTSAGTPPGEATITDTGSDTANSAAIDLELDKSVNIATAIPGDTRIFTLTLTNQGPSDATGVVVEDVLPGGLTYVSSSPAGYNDITGIWIVGNLAAGSTAQLDLTATVDTAGPYTNYTQVTQADQPDVDSTPGDDSATQDDDDVLVIDILPQVTVTKEASPDTLPEAGGDVDFTVEVTNTSPEPVELISLSDSMFGDLLAPAGPCTPPAGPIPVDGSYTCTFTRTITVPPGETHINEVTATVRDAQGNTAEAHVEEQVYVTDIMPNFTVVKMASPTTLNEPGGDVTFTVVVTNYSDEDNELTDLTDSVFGDLNAVGTCATGVIIPALGDYTCTFTRTITGPTIPPHQDFITATLADNDGNDDTQPSNEVTVNVLDIVRVTKDANPASVPEPGGPVLFSVRVENPLLVPITLTDLTDDVFGDLTVIPGSTCSVPQTIAPAGDYSCEFTGTVSGNAGDTHTNTITATVTDGDGNSASDTDDATVTVTNVIPNISVTKIPAPGSMNEPGGVVTFTVTVYNDSFEPVTLTDLNDSAFGDLTAAANTTCVTGGVIAPDDTYICTFDGAVTGDFNNPHTNTVTATVRDDDGSTPFADGSAIVSFADVMPTVNVVKTANPTAISEPGGDVEFTVDVINTSSEPVTLTSLSDSVYGDLSGDCPLGGTILPGATYTCTFTRNVSGEGDTPHDNTVTAIVEDNDDNTAEDSDTETVTIANVNPSVTVVKTANPTTLPEPGGDVDFTVVVRNTSAEPVELTTLVDDRFGDLFATGLCTAPSGDIPPLGSYTCTFTMPISGSLGDTHTNIITATVTDNENNTATDGNSETVTISDTPAITVEVVKTANPTTVIEPGGTVEFTVEVTNTSPVPVTLNSLNDSIYGNLSGDCPLGGTILPGETYSCTFTRNVSGAAGSTHDNTVTAIVEDGGGSTGRGQDTETVTVIGLNPSVEVVKTANPTTLSGLSGDVDFTIVVRNTSAEPVELTSLVDSVYGDLFGSGLCTPPSGDIPPLGSYTCTFTRTISGSLGDVHTNIVNATVTDSRNNTASDEDRASVTIQDVLPTIAVSKTPDDDSLPEPGGDVTFRVIVTNTSAETVILTSLEDSIFGNPYNPGECSVPQTIPARGNYACEFTRAISGDPGDTHTNRIIATAEDSDHHTATAEATATVGITDDLPTVTVTKTAAVAAINEPGGIVTYTVVVENGSTVEPVSLTSLVDDRFGDLFATGLCTAPTGDIPPLGSYSCTFSANVTGAVGSMHINTVTAIVEDDDGNSPQDSDTADVLITDVITVTKIATPDSLPEPGGVVSYTVSVFNLSSDTVMLTSLVDDVFGDLSSECGIAPLGVSIAAGGSYPCTFTRSVSGNVSAPHDNTITATVTDSTASPASDTASESVSFTDVPPMIEVTKLANPTTVNEPGGDVVFTVTVENRSPEALTLDSLNDSIFGDVTSIPGSTCTVPQTIGIGETYICNFTQTISGSAGDTHTNVVTASVIDDDTATVMTDSDDAVVTVNPTADLELSKAASNTSPDMGSTVIFTLTLTNQGPSTATGVEVTDLLPAGYGFTGATPTPGTTYDDTTGVWSVGTLMSGQTVTLDIDATVVAPGPYDNDTEVTRSNEFDSDSTPGNNSTDEDDDASVAVTPVSGCISGTLYLDENQNGVMDNGEAALPNVTMQLYSGATLVAEVITDTNGEYTFPTLPPGTYTVEIDQTTLPPGVPIFITPGNPRQDVVVSVGGTCAIGEFGLLIVDPAITKSGSPSQAHRGDRVIFTIQVTNQSTTTAMTNVVVRDPLNGYFDFVSATTTQGTATYDALTHVVTFDLGTLNANTSAMMVVRVDVSATAPRPTTITNRASVAYENGTTLTSPVVQVRVPSPSSGGGGDGSGSGSNATSTPTPTQTPVPGSTSGPSTLPNTGSRDAVLDGGDAVLTLALALLMMIGGVGLGLVLLYRRVASQSGRRAVLMIALVSLVGMAGIVVALAVAASPVSETGAVQTDVPAGQRVSRTSGKRQPTALPPSAGETEVTEPPVEGEVTPTAIGQKAPERLATRLLIPSLDVDAAIVSAPVVGETWDMSGLFDKVAYLEGTSYPGGPGNAVLAGHVTLKGGFYGPFVKLYELNPGDLVLAQDDELAYVYRVIWTEVVTEEAIEVTAPTDTPALTLITCTEWDAASRTYLKRLVVRAELIEQHEVGG